MICLDICNFCLIFGYLKNIVLLRSLIIREVNVLVIWMFIYDSEVVDKYGYGVVEYFVGYGVG